MQKPPFAPSVSVRGFFAYRTKLRHRPRGTPALLFAALCSFCFCPTAQALPEEGLFAEIETSHGSLTVALFYEEAPMTVANFIGLAEGTRAWVDPDRGQVTSGPYFDQQIFHRVIEGFIIQGGSPTSDGSGNPGFQFPDEPDAQRRHDGPGILSMANSGIDTNGSQFFITLDSTPWLDFRHTVFGEVIAGMDVVEAIGSVETDDADRPLDPVVLETITIHRQGTEAEAFDPSAQGLPVVSQAGLKFRWEESQAYVDFQNLPEHRFTLHNSSDLQNWNRNSLDTSPGDGELETLEVTVLTEDQDRQFFLMTREDRSPLPDYLHPEAFDHGHLILDFDTFDLVFDLHFGEAFASDQEEEWTGFGFDNVEPDGERGLNHLNSPTQTRGGIAFVLEGYVQFELELFFRTETQGTFTGQYFPQEGDPQNTHGTFTWTPPGDE